MTGPISWRSLLLAPAQAAAGFLFPSRCLACDRRPVEEFLRGGVCGSCWDSMPHPDRERCDQCDESLAAPDLSRCGRCGHLYGPAWEDPKVFAVMREGNITELSPLNRYGLTEEIVVRQYYCPGCATMFTVNIQRRGDPILIEFRLAFPQDPPPRRVRHHRR